MVTSSSTDMHGTCIARRHQGTGRRQRHSSTAMAARERVHKEVDVTAYVSRAGWRTCVVSEWPLELHQWTSGTGTHWPATTGTCRTVTSCGSARGLVGPVEAQLQCARRDSAAHSSPGRPRRAELFRLLRWVVACGWLRATGSCTLGYQGCNFHTPYFFIQQHFPKPNHIEKHHLKVHHQIPHHLN